MSLLTWSIAILIGLMFLAGLTYILWAIVAKIRLTKRKKENASISSRITMRALSLPDEYRDRMRDDE
jgi:hypothetical protein